MTSVLLPQLAASSAPHPLPAHVQRVVFTGFMGAGKSTLGRLLAAELGWDFLDLDTLIEARTGASIPALFEQHGELRFRQQESSALAAALGHSHTVLALGGGTPEILTNRLLLEQTPGTLTVFLEASFETLFDRCVLQGIDRPVLADVDRARARFAQRLSGYRRLARVTVNTEAFTPQETLAMLLNALSATR